MADGGAVDPTIFSGGIFYPIPDEDFQLLAIPIKLNRTNYHLWHWRVIVALSAAGKIGYVNGEIKRPAATDPTHRDWVRSNATVLLWLLDTLSDPIAKTFYHVDTAAELWDELEESFGRPNPARMVEIQTQVLTIQQGNLSVSDYLSELESLWAEYNFYRPLPKCGCDCEAVKALNKYTEEERVVCFLNGLNESFGLVRDRLLAKDPLPSVLDAFSDVRVIEFLREERERVRDGSRERLFCRYCKMDGHVSANCFKLKNRRRNGGI